MEERILRERQSHNKADLSMNRELALQGEIGMR